MSCLARRSEVRSRDADRCPLEDHAWVPLNGGCRLLPSAEVK
jgi:hypothetical protein